MSATVTSFAWPVARVPEAIELLARHSGYSPVQALGDPAPAMDPGLSGAVEHWIEETARRMGVRAEPVETAYADVDHLLARIGPALVVLPDNGAESSFVAVLGSRGKSVRVLHPARGQVSIPRRRLAEELVAPLQERYRSSLEPILQNIGGIRGEDRTGRALLQELLGRRPIRGIWLLRQGPRAGIRAHVPGLATTIVKLLSAHTAQLGLLIVAWWLMGWMALNDRFAPTWAVAWLLLFLTLSSLRLYSFVRAGLLSVDVGAYLRKRLLLGGFRVNPEELRREGAGHLLGRTLELEAIDSFTGSGALLLLSATVELAFAVWVLSSGVGGGTHLLLLALWTAALGSVAIVYYFRRSEWTDLRLRITHDLVEHMVGHRTRLVQEPREQRHIREDPLLARYYEVALRQDTLEVVLSTWIPRGWFVAGFAALVPDLVNGGGSFAAVAVGIGGVLLAQQAFMGFGAGLEQLIGALVAWRRVELLSEAADRHEPVGISEFATTRVRTGPGVARPILDARGIAFQYQRRVERVLKEIDLKIYSGERVLLEGPSGGGKSTLAAILSAARAPESGLLLLEGFDPATIGPEQWRRRVAFVPQFHDNHILMGTFAFNVLLGRTWPPTREDLVQAETVSRALGLGSLLDRMPGRMFQIVGETGWQLSHGERARLYIARAVLQDADIIILDESFAALDPHTLQSVMEYLFEVRSALIVIAHP